MCFKNEEKPTVSHRCEKHWQLVSIFFLFFAILPGTAARGERNEKIILWEVKACQ